MCLCYSRYVGATGKGRDMNFRSTFWFFYAILAYGAADNQNAKFKVRITWILLVLSPLSSIQKVKLRNYDTLPLIGTWMPINSMQGESNQDFLEHMCCMLCANLVKSKMLTNSELVLQLSHFHTGSFRVPGMDIYGVWSLIVVKVLRQFQMVHFHAKTIQ